MLDLNFLRAHIWAYDWLLRQIHPKGRCLEGHNRHQHFPHKFFLSVAVIPFQYEKMVFTRDF